MNRDEAPAASERSANARTLAVGRPSAAELCGYWAIRVTIWLFSLTVHRLRVGNRGAVPPRGGVLLVANHQSHLDVPYISMITRRVVHYLARRSLSSHPVLRFMLTVSRSILADRDGADREAFNQAVALLRMGEVLCLFPEGTRSPDGRVQPFRRGAELLARRAGVPVLPVGIAGTYEAWPRHRGRPRAGRLHIELGRLISPEEVARGEVDLFQEVVGLVRTGRLRLGLPELGAERKLGDAGPESG